MSYTVSKTESTANMVNTRTAAKKGEYKADVSLGISTDEVLKILELMNILATVNYYTEAVAGAITTSPDSKAAVAASVAMQFVRNEVRSSVGSDASIRTTDAAKGDVTLTSESNANARVVAVGPPCGRNGKAGRGREASASRTIRIKSRRTWAVRSQRPARSPQRRPRKTTRGSSPSRRRSQARRATCSVGGAVTAIINGATPRPRSATGAVITAHDLAVAATNDPKLTAISASLAARAAKVAVGGTVAVIVNKNTSAAAVGDNAVINLGGGADITAEQNERLINIICSASSSSSVAVAGALGVPVTISDTEAKIGAGTTLNARANVYVTAYNGADIGERWSWASPISTGNAGIGAVILVPVLKRGV